MEMLLYLYFSILLTSVGQVTPQPLRTSGRWITADNPSGSPRVKLACVNWPAHMEVMVAEGLTKQPLDFLAKNVLTLGFNCVRLTWPTYLVTNVLLADVTVRSSFEKNGLIDVIPALELNNPAIVDLPLVDAFELVVSTLARNKVMIILDNHVSKPGWCCSNSDTNAFFGDPDFDPDVWVTGLVRMATIFRDVPYVVGMSLRNELRGPRQNTDDWYKYMPMGAESVHKANPNLLVIISGLNFDLDLSFLANWPLSPSFSGKLVMERHWYAFSDGDAWIKGDPNEVCARLGGNFRKEFDVVVNKQKVPLFVSEFGIDQRGGNENDNRYIDCFLGLAAELDLDWAVWSYIGSYYLREGQKDVAEYFGVLDTDWHDIRNTTFLSRLFRIQPPFQKIGPSSSTRATRRARGSRSSIVTHD